MVKSKKSQRYVNYYKTIFTFFPHGIKMSGKKCEFLRRKDQKK